jgi:hypothetical protein
MEVSGQLYDPAFFNNKVQNKSQINCNFRSTVCAAYAMKVNITDHFPAAKNPSDSSKTHTAIYQLFIFYSSLQRTLK